MSMFRVFDIAASGMAAQTVRLNVTASNLANADVAADAPDAVYRAKAPVFATLLDAERPDAAMVRVLRIESSNAPAQKHYEPGNPNADGDGYVWRSNVNTVDEMVNMMSAARSYQNNVEILNTTKDLLVRTLNMGS